MSAEKMETSPSALLTSIHKFLPRSHTWIRKTRGSKLFRILRETSGDQIAGLRAVGLSSS